jgi:hypothetical protein
MLAWAPLAVIAAIQSTFDASHPTRSFFSDFAVHARYLIAVPVLILAEADCLPSLGAIARNFVSTGLIAREDMPRYERAESSTRRLLGSSVADIVTALLAYAVVGGVILYVDSSVFPDWYRGHRGGRVDLSVAGWWHTLVSLPLFLVLLFGWLWRLILWSRFLLLMSRLNLRLIASHPDRAGGLMFLSLSLRRFRLINFAIGSVVAGLMANRVIHHGFNPLGFRNFAIGLAVFIVMFFAGPLTVFVRRLRQTKRLGVLEYGALAQYLGARFEAEWLHSPIDSSREILKEPDFSTTTDLYAVVGNVHQMRDVPFTLRDLIAPVLFGLVPFVPVALLAIPLRVLIDNLVKLLL